MLQRTKNANFSNSHNPLLMHFPLSSSVIFSLHWNNCCGAGLGTPFTSSFSSSRCHQLPPFSPFLNFLFMLLFVIGTHVDLLQREREKSLVYYKVIRKKKREKPCCQYFNQDPSTLLAKIFFCDKITVQYKIINIDTCVHHNITVFLNC